MKIREIKNLTIMDLRILMDILLSTYTNSRDNNFNLIRFIAASLVLFSHGFFLVLGSGQFEPFRDIIGMSWGSVAVDIFFIISGFLITSSYLSRNNFIAFAWARFLRIYPALIFAIIFCIIIGACFTTLSLQEYYSNHQTHKYFLKNITLFFGVELRLPEVFMDVPYKGRVNGSLWTLPYEVYMYVCLTFILILISYAKKWINFISTKKVIYLVGIFSIVINLFCHFHGLQSLKSIRLFSMFFIGSSIYMMRDKINMSQKWFIMALTLLLLSSINRDLFFVVYCLILPFIVFYLAYVPSGKIRIYNKYGDYSYGIYIYSFPVQQSLVAIIPNISVIKMILISFVVTLFLSILSWHLIEKNSLKMKGYYVPIERFLRRISLIKN